MEKFTPYFFKLTDADRQASLEAIIFASDTTITLNELYDFIIAKEQLEKSEHFVFMQMETDLYVFENYAFNRNDIAAYIERINQDLSATGRPYQIVNYAKGYQYAVMPEYGELVANLVKSKTKKRLSQAKLETLAIVAYKQPVSKPQIEQIRGVNSNEIINSLLDKNLIKIVGRSEALGKPLVYGTTDDFLRLFGLNQLQDLPQLKELEEIPDLIIRPEMEGMLGEEDEFDIINSEIGLDSVQSIEEAEAEVNFEQNLLAAEELDELKNNLEIQKN